MLLDSHKRPIKDLRISVTDRCNFRCTYCMPFDEYDEWIDRRELLTYEEISRVAAIFLELGVEKIRLTTIPSAWAATLKSARGNLPGPFTEPTPVTVATMTLPMSKPMPKPREQGPMRSRSPAIDVIRGKGRSITQAPISSMTFNVKIAIRISMR